MKSETVRNASLGEEYRKIEHSSGLKVFVYPKPGYSSTYAIFGTDYGSIDNVLDGREIPEGTAHFLEHKLFESEEGDAFERFAETGADANAYTTFDKTCYLFSCSKEVEKNLSILMDFVRHPFFTEETVRKEQGIIGQEIRMYQDNPGTRLFYSLLDGMYSVHPVKTDIAGTEESISRITADLLYKCYDNFYNPGNMVLAVSGNVTPEQVMEIVDRELEGATGRKIERPHYNEPREVKERFKSETFEISMPLFALGYKEPAFYPSKPLKDRLITAVYLEYLAGDMSPFYERMLKEGLLNESFGYSDFSGNGFNAAIFEGISGDPEKVVKELKKEISEVKEKGLSEEGFQRIRKMYYGKAVMSYDNTEGIANSLVSACFDGSNLYDELSILERLTKEETEAALRKSLNDEYSTVSVILPREAN